MPSATVGAKKIELPCKLLLVPFFPGGKAPALPAPLRRTTYLHSQFTVFRSHALISGFIGYPHLLMLLSAVSDLRAKEVFFLGTAGAISERITAADCFQVREIYASSIFRLFSRRDRLPMSLLPSCPFPKADAVSVDLMSRENGRWLRRQKSRGIALVEMELFPLRVFLQKPFFAVLVASDRVAGAGFHPFSDRDRLKRSFLSAFESISGILHEN